MNVKKTKKFEENRPENYHVHDNTVFDWNTVFGWNAVIGWVARFNKAGCLSGEWFMF